MLHISCLQTLSEILELVENTEADLAKASVTSIGLYYNMFTAVIVAVS